MNHCNIQRIRANETKHLQHCFVDVIEAGAVVNGNHNTFRCGTGFSGKGNHNSFERCSHVEWTGNHCNLTKYTSRMTITGNHTCVRGQDCLVIGSHTRDEGTNTTLQSEHTQGESRPITLGRFVFNQVVEQAIQQPSSRPTTHYVPGTAQQPPVRSGYPPQLLLQGPRVDQPLQPHTTAIEYPTASTNPEPVTEDLAKMCSICMDREKCTVAIPCGCRYACITCVRASKPKTCALCRAPLKGIYRIYGE